MRSVATNFFLNIYEPKISIYDIYTSQWPFYCLTLKCDLDLQITEKKVSNEQLTAAWICMAWTSSNYDYFIIGHLNVTLTFNQPEQMFQMALLLFKENNFTKLFWNPCINVEVMAWTSLINDHFIIGPSIVTLTFYLPKQMFQMALLLLKVYNCAKLFANPCKNVGVMAQIS